MSAELLRHAAEVLRERAANTTPGVWKLWGMTVMADEDGTSNVDTAVGVANTLYRDEHGKPRTWDADYIAAMQPSVGLALADVLDVIAYVKQYEGESDYFATGAKGDVALTLARLIVGEES